MVAGFAPLARLAVPVPVVGSSAVVSFMV